MVRKSVFLGTAIFILGAALATAAHANGGNLDMKNLFTPKISADLHQNFLDFDRDRDGFITFAEFAYAYPRYYTAGDDPSPLSQHFAAMDTDGNGLISEKEFKAGHDAAFNTENYTMKWVPNGHKDSHN
jgi:Ca2+-binding EF-hand superfamily protein